MLIIGLIGPLASGKHLIADILCKQYGFISLEYQDFQEQKDQAAKKCLFTAKKTWPKNVVIIGIDSLSTMIELTDNPQFFPVAVQGPVLLRWQRRKHRQSIDSLEKFIQIDDDLQFGVQSSTDDSNQILKKTSSRSPLIQCMERCEFRIINDTNTRKDLEDKLGQLLAIDGKDQQLTTTQLLCPNWDQYFLMLAWITAAQ